MFTLLHISLDFVPFLHIKGSKEQYDMCVTERYGNLKPL